MKKIGDKISKLRLVDCKKHNEERTATERMSADEFSKQAASAYQQVMDLIDRYQRLDAAIIASNASTFVETSQGRYTVAAAIALRNRLKTTVSGSSTLFPHLNCSTSSMWLMRIQETVSLRNKRKRCV